VDVDGLYAFAVHDDFAPAGLSFREGSREHSAFNEYQASKRAYRSAKKIPASRHRGSPFHPDENADFFRNTLPWHAQRFAG